jgi:glycosyltransferase involved in cell wall biosynthesis
MLGRPGLFETFGGDRVQIEYTAGELKKLGVEVTIKTGLDFNPSSYDLVHVFQLDWNPDCSFQIAKAKKYGKPVVFSTIHHSIAEVKRFDDEYVFDFRRVSKYLFKDQFKRDLFKNLYRSLFDPALFPITVYCAFAGLKNVYSKALKMADIILVQTKAEAEDLAKTFGPTPKWVIVHNGVGESFLKDLSGLKNPFNFNNYIMCVGRIEPRKNQLNLIKAVKKVRSDLGVDVKLVLVGAKSKHKHFEYYMLFDKELKENTWIKHINYIPNNDMPVYYKFAKVVVLASWFETTGLTGVEALICGTNSVASGERVKEYLGTLSSYCDPGNADSIGEAIKKEYLAPRPDISANLRNLYTWKTAAKTTFEVYKELLNNHTR